jgi:orotidine-5'-phosphate decarboxylase
MADAAREAFKKKVSMLTVHTLSGPTALKEVSKVAKGTKTKILGVTILTSICQHFLNDLKIKRPLSDEVLYLAKTAKRCGLDGVVCSVHEAKQVRKACGKNFIIVTPGIRPKGSQKNDQQRASTPAEAKKAGADFIVVGRPILEAKDPLKAARAILKDL